MIQQESSEKVRMIQNKSIKLLKYVFVIKMIHKGINLETFPYHN